MAPNAVCGGLVAVIWNAVKATPSPPLAVSGELVMTGGPSVIVMSSVNCALVPKAFDPVSRTLVGPPTTVGVPEMSPEPALRVRPSGNGSSAVWLVYTGPAASVI